MYPLGFLISDDFNYQLYQPALGFKVTFFLHLRNFKLINFMNFIHLFINLFAYLQELHFALN